MTLLHIALNGDRALIATDTATYVSDQGAQGADVLYWADGRHVAVSKLYPLPHIRAVLTGRGTNTVHRFARDQIAFARDLDHAIQLLSRALPSLAGAELGTYKGRPLQHTVQLVGWSDEHEAMLHAQFSSVNEYRPVIATGSATGWCGSFGPGVRRPAWFYEADELDARQAEAAAFRAKEREREPRCMVTAAAYARAAVEQARSDDPAAPYGGRLLVAELTRDSLQIADAGDLGLPPRRAAALDIITALHPSLCIQPAAATDTYTDETGADSVSIPGTGGTVFKTCASRSYTNGVGRDVVVQFDAEVTELYFSSGATLAPPDDFCSATWVFKVNGTPVQTDSFIYTANDVAAPGATDRRTRMAGWQRTLNAGDTALIEISVGGGTDANAATISWARTRLRTTVIKA